MALADILSHFFVYAALAGYVVGGAWLLATRKKVRATLFVDSLLRTIIPLAIVQVLLVYAELRATSHEHPAEWVVITGIFAGLAAYLLWPVFMLSRSSGSGDGYIFFSRGVLAGLHHKLEELYGPSASRVIAYGIGRSAGQKDSAGLLSASNVGPATWWKFMPMAFRSSGLGKMRLVRVDPGKEVVFTVDDGFEVFHDHASGIPGCDLTRGYFAGVGKAMHPGKECHVEETRCAQAEGGHTCEFHVRWFDPVPMPGEGAAPGATAAHGAPKGA